MLLHVLSIFTLPRVIAFNYVAIQDSILTMDHLRSMQKIIINGYLMFLRNGNILTTFSLITVRLERFAMASHCGLWKPSILFPKEETKIQVSILIQLVKRIVI